MPSNIQHCTSHGLQGARCQKLCHCGKGPEEIGITSPDECRSSRTMQPVLDVSGRQE